MGWSLLSRGRGKGGVKGIWYRFVEYGQMRHLPRTIRESGRSHFRLGKTRCGSMTCRNYFTFTITGKNDMSIMKNKPISLHYTAGHELTASTPPTHTAKLLQVGRRQVTNPRRVKRSEADSRPAATVILSKPPGFRPTIEMSGVGFLARSARRNSLGTPTYEWEASGIP